VICFHGLVAVVSAAFLFGFAMGAFVAWDCAERSPNDDTKESDDEPTPLP
jgi:hypothetical protein